VGSASSWIVEARGAGIVMIRVSVRVRMRGFMRVRLRGGRVLLSGPRTAFALLIDD